MIDAPAFDQHTAPALIAPEQVEQVRRRRQKRTTKRTLFTIGAILILSDGTRCQIIQTAPTVLCLPLED